jgi:HEAT repeat protein
MPLYDPEYIDTLAARKDVKALIRALRDAETLELAKAALLQIGEPSIKHLVKALRDERVSFPASKLLKEIGSPAIKPLIEALDNKEGSGYAAAILEDIGLPSVPALIDALGKGKTSTRILAARALGVIGDGRAVRAVATIYLENLTPKINLILHDVCVEALKVLGLNLKYAQEVEIALDEFITKLNDFQYSLSPRSNKLLISKIHPDIRFRKKKRIVTLETRFKEKGKKRGWERVQSYAVKDELWKALRIAEIVMVWAESGDEPSP